MLCCSCEDWALQSFPRAQLEWQEASLWDLCSSDPSSRTRFNLFQAWGAVKKSFFEKQKPIPKRLSCTWMWLQSLNFKVEKAKLQCCLIRNKSLSQLIISDTFAIWAPISVSWLFTYYFFCCFTAHIHCHTSPRWETQGWWYKWVREPSDTAQHSNRESRISQCI